jgi:hypothetical protein
MAQCGTNKSYSKDGEAGLDVFLKSGSLDGNLEASGDRLLGRMLSTGSETNGSGINRR